MKIFKPLAYGKTNFVDDNNVLVGWDDADCCCEDHGFLISAEKFRVRPAPDIENPNDDYLLPFVFDPSFFEKYDFEKYEEAIEEGGVVVFRLTDGSRELFLHLFNFHNGYYAHGFEFSKDGQGICEGYL